MSGFQKNISSLDARADLFHRVDTNFSPVVNRFILFFVKTGLPERSCLSQNEYVKEKNGFASLKNRVAPHKFNYQSISNFAYGDRKEQ